LWLVNLGFLSRPLVGWLVFMISFPPPLPFRVGLDYSKLAIVADKHAFNPPEGVLAIAKDLLDRCRFLLLGDACTRRVFLSLSMDPHHQQQRFHPPRATVEPRNVRNYCAWLLDRVASEFDRLFCRSVQGLAGRATALVRPAPVIFLMTREPR